VYPLEIYERRVRSDQSWYLGDGLTVRIWPRILKSNGVHTCQSGSIAQTQVQLRSCHTSQERRKQVCLDHELHVVKWHQLRVFAESANSATIAAVTGAIMITLTFDESAEINLFPCSLTAVRNNSLEDDHGKVYRQQQVNTVDWVNVLTGEPNSRVTSQ
jgi:hypothetical protein